MVMRPSVATASSVIAARRRRDDDVLAGAVDRDRRRRGQGDVDVGVAAVDAAPRCAARRSRTLPPLLLMRSGAFSALMLSISTSVLRASISSGPTMSVERQLAADRLDRRSCR